MTPKSSLATGASLIGLTPRVTLPSTVVVPSLTLYLNSPTGSPAL